jgi:hypothetical protein
MNGVQRTLFFGTVGVFVDILNVHLRDENALSWDWI